MAIVGNIKLISLNGNTYKIIDSALRETIASEYDTTAGYTSGDYCINDGTVYKCNANIASPAGAWDSTKWTAVKVMDEIHGKVDTSDLPNINVGSATKLQTARNLEGVAFDGQHGTRYYGVDSASTATVARAVTITYPDATSTSEAFTLETGARVIVKFTNGTSVNNPTLNVNGKGAKKILYKNAGLDSTHGLEPNGVYEFVYDATGDSNSGAWLLVGVIENDLEISVLQITDLYRVSDNLVYYGTCTTENSTATGGSATKNVTLATGDVFPDTLTAGLHVRVKFTKAQTGGISCSLKVGSTDAKAISWHGQTTTQNTPAIWWQANSVMDFVYDGTNWVIVDNGLAYTYVNVPNNTETLNIISRQ